MVIKGWAKPIPFIAPPFGAAHLRSESRRVPRFIAPPFGAAHLRSEMSGSYSRSQRVDATRRVDAATPVTCVGVCQLSSSAAKLWGLQDRTVPARDVIAAPSPTVVATHVTAIAAARRIEPTTGVDVKIAAPSQSARYAKSPM